MDVTQATTQAGAAAPVDTESHFEGLWQSGAFDKDGVPPKESEGGAPESQTATQTDPAQNAQTGSQEADDTTQQQGATEETQGQQATEEAPAYASLDELLTSLKVDPTSALKLHVTTKIDGVETKVPLEQVLKSYQLEGHVNNKSIELSNQKTQFEQERQAVRNAFQQQFQHNQALGQLALQMVNQDYQRVDWQGLRQTNPAEFAALQQEFQQRQQGVHQYLGQLQAQAQQAAQQQQHEQQQTMQQQLQAENERLMSARPEWRDQKAFSKDRDQMTQYARNQGFKDAELSQILDHRYMLILHDAARYQALQANSPQVLKQVRQAPVMAAPGSRVDVNPKEARRQQAIERFNRNPRDVDAQAAYFDTLD